MRFLRLILLLPIIVILRLLRLGRKDMVFLPEGHPEMAQAFAEVKATLPEFRRALESESPDCNLFCLKVRFPADGGGSEHIWINEVESTEKGFSGKIANHPQSLPSFKLGTFVEVSDDMVSDWDYAKSGVHQGHFTTRVLLPRMSKKMRREVEQMFGWTR